VEKCVKATIRQAASPVVREAMSSAYKAAIPRRHGHRVPRGQHAVGGQGHQGRHPREACLTVCLAVLEVIPGKAERTRLRNIMADELENIDQDTGNIAYCASCGKAFSPVNRNHRYCRPACRTARTSRRSTEEDPSGQRNTARMRRAPRLLLACAVPVSSTLVVPHPG
jgi:hypothetical protein